MKDDKSDDTLGYIVKSCLKKVRKIEEEEEDNEDKKNEEDENKEDEDQDKEEEDEEGEEGRGKWRRRRGRKRRNKWRRKTSNKSRGDPHMYQGQAWAPRTECTTHLGTPGSSTSSTLNSLGFVSDSGVSV